MNRRDFLKTSAIAGVGLSISLPLDFLIDSCEAAYKSELIVATGQHPGKITRTAVEALGGMQR